LNDRERRFNSNSQLSIEILCSKVDMGFQAISARLDDLAENFDERLRQLDKRLELIEKNNTNLKLSVQQNTLGIKSLEKDLTRHITATENAEAKRAQDARERREFKYKKISIFLTILSLLLGGMGLKYIFDIVFSR